MWAYGGTVAVEGPPRSADLDTYVIVRRPIDEPAAEAIEGVHEIIGEHMGVEWDAWYVLEADGRTRRGTRGAKIDSTRRGQSIGRTGSPAATCSCTGVSPPRSSHRRRGPSSRSTSTESWSTSKRMWQRATRTHTRPPTRS